MNLHGVPAEFGELAGDAVIPARPDGHDEIAVGHRLVGISGAVHAQHPQMKRLILGNRTLAQQGGDHGRLQLLCQTQNGLARVRDDCPVADVKHRASALAEQFCGLLEILGVGPLGHVVAGQVHRIHKGRVAGTGGQILGQVDQHRSRSASGGDVERLFNDARDVRSVAHQIAVLDHRVGDTGDVGLLKGVLAQQGPYHLRGDDHHGDGIHERGVQAGDGVGGARTGGHQDHARFAGGAGVAVSHVGRALLVANPDQLDLRPDEGIEERDGRAAGQAENDLHPFALQALYDLLATGRDLFFGLARVSRLATKRPVGARLCLLLRCRLCHLCVFLSKSSTQNQPSIETRPTQR